MKNEPNPTFFLLTVYIIKVQQILITNYPDGLNNNNGLRIFQNSLIPMKIIKCRRNEVGPILNIEQIFHHTHFFVLN